MLAISGSFVTGTGSPNAMHIIARVSFPGPEQLPVYVCIDNSANFFDEMSPRPALYPGLVGAGCWMARTAVPPIRHRLAGGQAPW